MHQLMQEFIVERVVDRAMIKNRSRRYCLLRYAQILTEIRPVGIRQYLDKTRILPIPAIGGRYVLIGRDKQMHITGHGLAEQGRRLTKRDRRASTYRNASSARAVDRHRVGPAIQQLQISATIFQPEQGAPDRVLMQRFSQPIDRFVRRLSSHGNDLYAARHS